MSEITPGGKAFQYCDGVIGVQIHERMYWEDGLGAQHGGRPEPVWLVDGTLPPEPAAQAEIVAELMARVMGCYGALDFIKRIWWE